MKDIKSIIEAYSLTDEEKKAIVEAVNANYKTVEEFGKKTSRIEALEAQNAELTEQVETMTGNADELEALRSKVEEFKAAEKQRKAEEAEAKRRDDFGKTFDEALGDREFANATLRDAIFEKAYAQCSATTGASAEAVIAELTDGQDGMWKNPQTDPQMMPDPASITTKKPSAEETAKQTIADFLFPKKEA